MKIHTVYMKSLLGVIAFSVMVSLASCEDNIGVSREAAGPPQLERVSLVEKDSTVTVGSRGQTYVIFGKNLAATESVTFNGAEANVNPVFARYDNIIVRIPDDAPYIDASDKIVVTNSKGSAELPFKIMQPPPEISDFSPKAGGPGDIVTINGEIFDNLESVRFEDKEAEIISSTPTQIVVEVPDGVVQAQIYVETQGGVSVSEASFGFKYVIYDDALAAGWQIWGWGGTTTVNNTSVVKRGTHAVQQDYSGAWGGFQIHNSGDPIDLSGYTAVKLSIYGGPEAGDVQVYLNNNNDGTAQVLSLTSGEWTDFTLPLSDLGNRSELIEIVIQTVNNAPVTIYIDDIGLI